MRAHFLSSAATVGRRVSPPVAGPRHVIDGTALRRVCERAAGRSEIGDGRSAGADWEATLIAAMLTGCILGVMAMLGAFVAVWIGGGR